MATVLCSEEARGNESLLTSQQARDKVVERESKSREDGQAGCSLCLNGHLKLALLLGQKEQEGSWHT